MSDAGFMTRFALAALATWRVTHLLANEDGPGDAVVRLRARLGAGPAGRLMDCFQCLSIWIAAPMTLVVSREPGNALPTWLALSGAACLLERTGKEPVMLEAVRPREQGGESHGLLWPEADRIEARADAG